MESVSGMEDNTKLINRSRRTMFRSLKKRLRKEIFEEDTLTYLTKIMLRDALVIRTQGVIFMPIIKEQMFKKITEIIDKVDVNTDINIRYQVFPNVRGKSKIVFPKILTKLEADYFIIGEE